MKKKTAEKALAQPQQGLDFPALNSNEIAALRLLHYDEELDFFGELPERYNDTGECNTDAGAPLTDEVSP
jgi:hypothetical protein